MSHNDIHPYAQKWSQPTTKDFKLYVYNTLTRTKVPFHPSEGNSIRWYNCGPTVYDSSHIGHARNYVTFDIIRRILEDYFNYDVTLIMNITDIDDKIILRARQTFLVQKFREEHPAVDDALIIELKDSLNEFIKSKLDIYDDEGWVVLEKSLSNDKEPSEDSDAKKRMHFTIAQKARKALEGAKVGEQSTILLDSFGDILAVKLDAKFGASVTDQKIFRDLAAYWENEFLLDMKALNVRPVSLMTRVSEFVPQIVECTQRILDNGYAYESQGSVYFDVNSFTQKNEHLYAKLCPWNAGNSKFFEEGEGALGVKLVGKKDPRDFALWKASKAGEPFWDSPWGPGRPGWHIECSAMAAAVAPGPLDIHSGGIDLAFPHHDNELAQSEAFYECPQWVNYFMHAGHVHIEGHKMSKSLKNFITIRDALERYNSRQLRIMFLQHQWHAPVFYKESSMVTAVAVESLFTNFFNNINALLRSSINAPPCAVSPSEIELMNVLTLARNRTHELLCDNFDTPAVLLQLQDLVNKTNIYIQSTPTPNHYILRMIGAFVTKMLKVFGVIESNNEDTIGFENNSLMSQDSTSLLSNIVQSVSEYRDKVREIVLGNRDSKSLLSLSDELRNKLFEEGVILEDRAEKSTLVKIVNKSDVARLKSEQAGREAEKLARKLEMARINEAKQAQKIAKASVKPQEMFLNDTSFGKFDENGIPTHDSTGVELSKNARKKVMKEYESQVELHQKFLDGKL